MNKKNILSLLLFFASFLIVSNSVNAITTVAPSAEKITVAVDADEIEKDEVDILKKFSLKNRFKRTPKIQIESFYKKYNKFSEKNETKKLKDMYSDVFVNNDGFDKETIFKLMEEASSAYTDVTYTTEIIDMDVNEQYAVVRLKEKAIGKTSQKFEKIDDYGVIESTLFYKNYLRKENGKWKITSAEIESEKIALKYGEAKKAIISMTAPQTIPAGVEYEAIVNVESPDGCFVVGSIVNEQIKYPQSQPKDVLRAVKSDELARILTSNMDNNNEYATVSLGFTRPQIEPPSVVIQMTGMAIVMSRVNVIKNNNIVKDEKEFSDGKTSN